MSEKHPLEDLEFTTQEDENGIVTRIDGEVVGNISPTFRGDLAHRQAQAALDASTEADQEEYERLCYEDPDFEVVRDEMARLAGLVDEQDAAKINSDYRTFNREFHATKSAMVGAALNRPRTDEIDRLREQLHEEDSQTGGRNTARREALVQRIARLHGGR